MHKNGGMKLSTIYERLNWLCKENKITGAKMCRDLGFSKSMMTDLKMGRKKGVNADTAYKIAEYFGVTVAFLLGEEEKEKPTVQDDGLTENQRILMEFVKGVPDDKAAMVLRVMKSMLEDSE